MFEPGMGGGEDERGLEIPLTPDVRRKLFWPLRLSSFFPEELRIGWGYAVIGIIKMIIVVRYWTFIMSSACSGQH